MQTLAAILVELGKPLELVDLNIPVLKSGQTLIEIAFSGVCHTQISEARGRRGPDRFLPHCLGHEGSGVVREVGPGVSRVKPGDRVVLSWIKGSGAEVPGTQYDWNGRAVNAGGVTTFSRYAVVSENRLTPLEADLPLDRAALLGCAIPTGVGIVFNTARVQPGQSVAVFGAGGIGLCAIAGAAAAGATTIIAIDRLDEKLTLARSVGATHTINVDQTPVGPALQELCPGGVDVAIEATGLPPVMQQALEAVRPRGGTAVIAGNPRAGDLWSVDPRQFNQGKRILGTWGGDNEPDRDFPQYQQLLLQQRLPLDCLIERRYALTEINQALDDLEAGRAARPLIDMSR